MSVWSRTGVRSSTWKYTGQNDAEFVNAVGELGTIGPNSSSVNRYEYVGEGIDVIWNRSGPLSITLNRLDVANMNLVGNLCTRGGPTGTAVTILVRTSQYDRVAVAAVLHTRIHALNANVPLLFKDTTNDSEIRVRHDPANPIRIWLDALTDQPDDYLNMFQTEITQSGYLGLPYEYARPRTAELHARFPTVTNMVMFEWKNHHWDRFDVIRNLYLPTIRVADKKGLPGPVGRLITEFM